MTRKLLTGFPIRWKDENHEREHHFEELEGLLWYVNKINGDRVELISEDGCYTTTTDISTVEPDATAHDLYGSHFLDCACSQVRDGASFSVDLKKKTFRLGKDILIDEGKSGYPLGFKNTDTETAMEEIKTRYRQYRHSIPGEKDSRKPSRYFKALQETELSDEDMLYGIRRNTAQLQLELYLLIQIINGTLKWEEPAFNREHWFWQCPEDKDLIILKEWF